LDNIICSWIFLVVVWSKRSTMTFLWMLGYLLHGLQLD
jgi:hypothetical protein